MTTVPAIAMTHRVGMFTRINLSPLSRRSDFQAQSGQGRRSFLSGLSQNGVARTTKGMLMTDSSESLSRRDLLQGALSGAVLFTVPAAALAAGDDADKAAVRAQIPKMHAENVKRLQDWIALPSIAAENRNYPQGAEYMAKLATDAGFSGVKIIPN